MQQRPFPKTLKNFTSHSLTGSIKKHFTVLPDSNGKRNTNSKLIVNSKSLLSKKFNLGRRLNNRAEGHYKIYWCGHTVRKKLNFNEYLLMGWSESYIYRWQFNDKWHSLHHNIKYSLKFFSIFFYQCTEYHALWTLDIFALGFNRF